MSRRCGNGGDDRTPARRLHRKRRERNLPVRSAVDRPACLRPDCASAAGFSPPFAFPGPGCILLSMPTAVLSRKWSRFQTGACLCISLRLVLAPEARSAPTGEGELVLTDPHQVVTFHLTTNPQGQLLYRVRAHGREALLSAPTGLLLDDHDLGQYPAFGPVHRARHYEEFDWLGGKNRATNDCYAYEIPVRSGLGPAWTLEVRLFRDAAAFRHLVPAADSPRHIRGETTAWHLPPGAVLWFQTNLANHEGIFQSLPANTLPASGALRMGLPVTAVLTNGITLLISEARLLDYSGLALESDGPDRLRAIFPHDPHGWPAHGPIASPWRVVLVTTNLDPLVNSDVIPTLCDPPDPERFPQGARTDWIRPGRAPCTWMVFGNGGARWARQKWFVDTAAALGCEYLLVDGGWQTERWGWIEPGADLWDRMAELCRYAAERNVGILVWHGYPEGRDDGPGLTRPEDRETFFRRCAEAGVKGVKIDFFDSESIETVRVVEDLRRRAARYRLLISFHGIPKPTGLNRTWPHELTREGIREQEYQLWSSLPLEHYGALPFTRLVVGPADFLPGYIRPSLRKDTTLGFQLATTIIFSSPLLCWPDHPEAYLESPALSFFRRVPTVWDETRVLPPSRIGRIVALARRHRGEWYVALLNCTRQAVPIPLDPSSFITGPAECTLYTDDPDRQHLQIRTGPASGERLSLQLPSGGGAVVHFRPTPLRPGWP